jgi:hypothetical protein
VVSIIAKTIFETFEVRTSPLTANDVLSGAGKRGLLRVRSN